MRCGGCSVVGLLGLLVVVWLLGIGGDVPLVVAVVIGVLWLIFRLQKAGHVWKPYGKGFRWRR